MQTWDAITSRRNVRSFANRPIAAADLDQILEAGRRAPSSQNWQPWDFIVVTDRGQLRELARVWRGAGHVAVSAATIVVIGPADDNAFGRAQFDLGQATMAMLLAAADLGIGSKRDLDRAGLGTDLDQLPSEQDGRGRRYGPAFHHIPERPLARHPAIPIRARPVPHRHPSER
jgi:nitroreductase